MTRGRMACAGVLLCASVHIPAAHGQDKPEYELKALFFVTLARYTHWPSNTFSSLEQPLIIAVLGQDPFGKKLESLVTRERVQGRPVRVARFSTLEEITECHMIFLTEDNPAQMDL